MEWVAHRAGNLASTVVDGGRRADVVELDVHLFRGRMEVRHGKVLWPFARLWEKWEFLPDDSPRPDLRDILAAAPDDLHLWFDLKGFTGRLTRRVLAEVGDRRPITVSTRNWWILSRARRLDGVRTMKSVGSRWQRLVVTRTRFGSDREGVVIHERLLDAAQLVRLHRRTPTVISWGVTDVDRATELIAMGISGLIVDDLTLIDQVAAASGRPPVDP